MKIALLRRYDSVSSILQKSRFLSESPQESLCFPNECQSEGTAAMGFRCRQPLRSGTIHEVGFTEFIDTVDFLVDIYDETTSVEAR